MLSSQKHWLPLVSLALALIGCANESAIRGGDEDKTPPQILYSTPVNETVNTDLRVEIFIKFDEQMKKSTFASALQIWPRPPGGYELKSGWTWLKLNFNEDLDTNETYLLTLDKSALDLQGNGLASTYTLAFTTGSELNAGRLTGMIHGPPDIQKNGDLLLYRNFELTLQELRQMPADYVFQADNTGHFELPYLAERSYMLFYHWDRNRNKLIDGDDYFSRPEQASVQASADSSSELHKLWPHLRPMEQLKLLEVSALDAQFIQIRAARSMAKMATGKFDLISDKVKLPILGSSLVAEDEFAIHIDLAIPIKDTAEVWLQKFVDTSGYELNSDTLTFKQKSSYDTLLFEPLQVVWENGKNVLFPNEQSNIRIGANLPFTFKTDTSFQLVDTNIDSIPIPGELNMLSSMLWEFQPDTALDLSKIYMWQVLTDQIFAPLNTGALDSLMTGELLTINPDSLGSIRIMHMGDSNLILTLRAKSYKEKFNFEPGIPLLIEHLPAQKYSLTAFLDLDGNGQYNSGDLGPAAASEPFWIYPDEIRIRARWETDMGIWELE